MEDNRIFIDSVGDLDKVYHEIKNYSRKKLADTTFVLEFELDEEGESVNIGFSQFLLYLSEEQQQSFRKTPIPVWVVLAAIHLSGMIVGICLTLLIWSLIAH